MKILIDFYRNT